MLRENQQPFRPCGRECPSQLSLIHKKTTVFTMVVYVENTGVEPVTSCLPGKRSSQLS